MFRYYVCFLMLPLSHASVPAKVTSSLRRPGEEPTCHLES